MSQPHKRLPLSLRCLSIGNKRFLTSVSGEGNTIAERIKQRRRRNQVETERVESENPFLVFEQEKEPQSVQEEQEVITETSEDEEMQDEETDAVTTLLAKVRSKEVPQVVIPEPVSGSSASSLRVASQQIEIESGPIQSVEILTGSERFFEDNAMQKGRFRVKKTFDDIMSSIHVNTAFSSFIEKHSEEFNQVESFITKNFAKWELQLNFNQNILFYGFGSKEHILEHYQTRNKNKDITWAHFHGNGDLLTLNFAFLMLLENLFGPNHIFSNFTLVRKADLIRDYFKVTIVKTIFKIIVGIIYYYYYFSLSS